MLGESPCIYRIDSAAVTPITNRRASPLITLKNDINTHTHISMSSPRRKRVVKRAFRTLYTYYYNMKVVR